MKWVNATDIQLWANRREAQAQLPGVIRKLAFATLNNPLQISFRTGEGVVLPGYDGYIETEESNAFVPLGKSVWEVSTDAHPSQKASTVYSERTSDPQTVEPGSTTIIFVYARRHPNKETWAREKTSDAVWKEVRAMDADDLETWLELAPAVGSWFAKLIGKYARGVTALSDYWHEWQFFTEPTMPSSLLLQSREKETNEITKWLETQPSALTLVSDSTSES